MSWGRVENPKKVFKVGETVKVLIKDINGDKIALSLKFPEENPWLNAADKYAVGNVVEGCVARMTDFGAFVELEPGVDALLHVSQISREHVEKPSDAPKIGQVIPDFCKFCEGCMLVGHNVQFDYKFVRYYAEQEEYDFEFKTYDTMSIAQSMLFLSNYKLNTLADHYHFTFNHHRAWDDAYVTAKIFIELIKAKKCLPKA